MRSRREKAGSEARTEAMPETGACTTAGSTMSNTVSIPVIANGAVDRELAGWCWSLLDSFQPLIQGPTNNPWSESCEWSLQYVE